MERLLKISYNSFTERNISDESLLLFANDCIHRLVQYNDDDHFTLFISALDVAIKKMQDEFNRTSASNSTKAEFVTCFRKRMHSLHSVIAFKLGGVNKPAMQDFYPNGIDEYSEVNEQYIPVIFARLMGAIEKHATDLGREIISELKSYHSVWEQINNSKSSNDGEKCIGRKKVEIALIRIIHNIVERHPNDVQQCMKFFDLDLLNWKVSTEENAQLKANVSS